MRLGEFSDRVRRACGYRKKRDPSYELGVREQDLAKVVASFVKDESRREGVLKNVVEFVSRSVRPDKRVPYTALYLASVRENLIVPSEPWAFLAG